jgi:hypothetical protein
MRAGTQFEANQAKWVNGICEGRVPITEHTREALQRRRTRLTKQLEQKGEYLTELGGRVGTDLDHGAFGLHTTLMNASRNIEELSKALLELNEAEGFVASYLEVSPPTELAV